MTEEVGSAQPKAKIVPVVWSDPGSSVFANQAVVQYDGNLVYLAFGQANPPVISGDTEEEKQQQLDKIHSIVVSPVIRLVMAPESFRAVVKVLRSHLERMDNMDRPEQASQEEK